MKNYYEELTDSFENLAINPANFGHVDHVGVAYVMLTRYDFISAMYKYSCNIDIIATSAGVPKKFNVTITLALISIISERMKTTKHDDVCDFIDRNQDLITNNPLKEFYSTKRLQSDRARTMFLLPDIAA